MPNLETTYLGIKLKNPLVAASSGLTGSLEKIRELSQAGIGAVVLKSIFEEQINNEVGSMLSSGAQNMDYPEAEDYIRSYLRDNSISKQTDLVSRVKKETDLPVIASVNCIAGEEWTSFAGNLAEAGADALELNVFNLPTDRLQSSAEIEQLYLNVVKAVRGKTTIPVSVKIGSHFTNIVRMADQLKANGAAGIVMFNRFYEPDINLDRLELSASEVFSSPQELRRGLRWTGLVASQVPALEIAASTGIHTGDAVVKQLLAGAQVAQLCSTLYVNGSQVVGQILDELVTFMRKWNFRRLEDFRGRLSYKNIDHPMLYERSQFMKYYSSRE
jgi:dihydroorotate dehydrogenase (fumarate)